MGFIGAKYFSGYLGGRYLKYSKSESGLIGFSSIPQLSTTLGVGFIAVDSGFISLNMVAALVVLSIVTILISPLWIRQMVKKYHIEHPLTVNENPPL
ncbi:MAG: cation:proton antiporter domain-containing protein [Candidatus Ranarchaeia archaeon]